MEFGIGVIGGGFMGRTWSHVAQLAPGTPLRAVAGGRRAAGLARDYDVAEEPSVEKLLAREDVDIVIVTSPPRVHPEQVMAAAAAGKHVLVEKPMARNADDCRAMVKACDDAGVTLAVVSQHRFRNSPRAVKQLIDDAVIGDLRMVQVTGVDQWWDMTESQDEWKLDPDQMTVFDDWGAHGCDVLRWFVGAEPVMAFAQSEHYTVDGPPGQSTMATFRFANQVMAQVWMSYEVPLPGLGSALQYLITGSKGLIQVDVYGEVRLGLDGAWSVPYSQPSFDPLNAVDPLRLEAYRRELDDVVGAVRTSSLPLVNGAEALRTQQMLDAVTQSARTGSPVWIQEEA
jgi:UDP-N-acetyl-2-amino-2-deoxyglucuronate dehydrogenase